jgi:hypothetical protein
MIPAARIRPSVASRSVNDPDDPPLHTTVRLRASQMRRAKKVAVDHDTTFTDLVKVGLNLVFKAYGLAPLDPESTTLPQRRGRR